MSKSDIASIFLGVMFTAVGLWIWWGHRRFKD